MAFTTDRLYSCQLEKYCILGLLISLGGTSVRFQRSRITVIALKKIELEKIMHLLLTPMLAFDDTGVATTGAVFILILSVAALIRSRMA
jgi:hypothetical protein